MNFAVIVCSITIASAFYTDMDENIDIDGIMADKKKMQTYMDCYLDKKPCTKQAEAYKSHLVDLFSNACQNCDAKFKHISEEVLLNLLVKYPDEMKQFIAKYDPTGANLPKLVAVVSKY